MGTESKKIKPPHILKETINMCDLSVLVPGIRPHNWTKLYNSIPQSTKRPFEVIFVGPNKVSLPIEDLNNVTYIEDYGTPIRCQQIALTHAVGDWIIWAADDGYFTDNSIDTGFNLLKQENYNPLTVIMGKYFEGNDDYSDDSSLNQLEYYQLNTHNIVLSGKTHEQVYQAIFLQVYQY